MKKISVFGTGYVGLVGGACLADFGNDVICVDIDEEKINKLKEGVIPIYEPGLKEVVEKNVKLDRLSFTTDSKKAIEETDVIFISVGTPQDEDGSADLQHVLKVAETIGENLNGYKVIVDKSTVPVGTGQKVKEVIRKTAGEDAEFDVVSNPEFLREGNAVHDFLLPNRVVIGSETKKAAEIMQEIYKPLYLLGTPMVVCDIETAEMIKYAANAFLATKITFINEVSEICERVGANVNDVAKGIGLDKRIGPKFLHAGAGYGGSCFPKDTNALKKIAEDVDYDFGILDQVIKKNEAQKRKMVQKIMKFEPDLKDKTVAVLGLSFKPKTDDMREAPAIIIINEVLNKGGKVKTFDPVAMDNAKKILPKEVQYCKNAYDAAEGADVLVLVTEWHDFRGLDLFKMAEILNKPQFLDCRNVYDPEEVKNAGLKYLSVGRPKGNNL